ncbi:hypothetical protein OG559_14255 [Micromonospora sp. NBC_01405]|uniref:hypothetical protein n=1 Tax=Micromonospora sp. NBC_01405 TaxID=2903589 RepID=UPI00324AD073
MRGDLDETLARLARREEALRRRGAEPAEEPGRKAAAPSAADAEGVPPGSDAGRGRPGGATVPSRPASDPVPVPPEGGDVGPSGAATGTPPDRVGGDADRLAGPPGRAGTLRALPAGPTAGTTGGGVGGTTGGTVGGGVGTAGGTTGGGVGGTTGGTVGGGVGTAGGTTGGGVGGTTGGTVGGGVGGTTGGTVGGGVGTAGGTMDASVGRDPVAEVAEAVARVVATHPGVTVTVRVEHDGQAYPLRVGWSGGQVTVGAEAATVPPPVWPLSVRTVPAWVPNPDQLTADPTARLAELIRRDQSLFGGLGDRP